MQKDFEKKSQGLFNTFSSSLHQNPEAYTQMLWALDFALGPSQEIVIAGEPSQKATQEFVVLIFSRFLPNKVVALHPTEPVARQAIESLAPFVEFQVMKEGKATVYVCKNYVCQFPVTQPSELEKLL
jgi:uncharacterized protein YyaL (SSP411 family)